MFKLIGKISTVLVVLFVLFAALHPANDDLYNEGVMSWSSVKDTFSAVWRVMKGDNNVNNFVTGYTTMGKEKIKKEYEKNKNEIKKTINHETKKEIKKTINEEINSTKKEIIKKLKD